MSEAKLRSSVSIKVSNKFASMVSLGFADRGPFKGSYMLQVANHEGKKRYSALVQLTPYELGSVRYLINKELDKRPIIKKKGMKLYESS